MNDMLVFGVFGGWLLGGVCLIGLWAWWSGRRR
jgi:hypothetical protein